MNNTRTVQIFYVITETGRMKLDQAARKRYNTDRYKLQLSKELKKLTDIKIDRTTISKIVNAPQPGSNNQDKLRWDSLFKLSKFLDCKVDFLQEYVKGNSQIGTFLIHGEQDYGQQWLLNRLATLVPYYDYAYKKSHNITRRKDIQSVWEDLGETFETESKPHIIAQQIYKQWETKPIILAIRGIELIKGDCLKQLLCQFWWELVEMGQNKPASTLPLLLFLVDNQGCNCQLGIELLTEIELNKPQHPLDLSPIQGFTNSDLILWCRSQVSGILREVNNCSAIDELEQIIAQIVSRNTNPIFALEAISTSCNLNWYTHIEGKFTL